jgi:Macrocin-O-methyltransferase (TylF)
MNTSPGLKNSCLTLAKDWLTRLGAVVPAWSISYLDESLNYLEVGRWLRSKGYKIPTRFRHRNELFDLIAAEVGDHEALYLEFGVYYGESMRYWSKILKNPRSILHGFDSFMGLPEPWKDNAQTGSFSTRGEVPVFDDPRVKLFIGLFGDVLPGYRVPDVRPLIINIDADLYSSTIYVLRALRGSIVSGTYIYFDEFFSRGHELRAFDEFIRETGLGFRLLGADRTLHNVVFQAL